MPLIRASEVRGGHAITEGEPPVVVARDVMMRPMGRVKSPGIYDADGLLVEAAAYRRGEPDLHYPIEEPRTVWHRANMERPSTRYRYIFAGHLTGHYGHFLYAIVARLWTLPRPVPADVRIVLLNGFHIDDLFEQDFARAIFGAIGLTREHFARFAAPVLFDELIIPTPGIEENIGGYRGFADFCHRIGRALVDAPPIRDERPVFLSKRRLASGVHRFVNEDAFCAALERRGVEIVSPEQLSFHQQVALWASRSMVAGMFGSILHTSIFCPRRRYVALNTDPRINSTQTVLDLINGNVGTVMYPADDYNREPAAAGFEHNLRLHDPERTAAAFHAAMMAEAAAVRRDTDAGR